MEGTFQNQTVQSHKGEIIKSYRLKFKSEAVMHPELRGNRLQVGSLMLMCGAYISRRRKRNKLVNGQKKSSGKERRTLGGAGRKTAHEFVESKVLEWIYDHREKILRVSRILIKKKAKIKSDTTQASSEAFVASCRWLCNFMRGHELSLGGQNIWGWL